MLFNVRNCRYHTLVSRSAVNRCAHRVYYSFIRDFLIRILANCKGAEGWPTHRQPAGWRCDCARCPAHWWPRTSRRPSRCRVASAPPEGNGKRETIRLMADNLQVCTGCARDCINTAGQFVRTSTRANHVEQRAVRYTFKHSVGIGIAAINPASSHHHTHTHLHLQIL